MSARFGTYLTAVALVFLLVMAGTKIYRSAKSVAAKKVELQPNAEKKPVATSLKPNQSQSKPETPQRATFQLFETQDKTQACGIDSPMIDLGVRPARFLRRRGRVFAFYMSQKAPCIRKGQTYVISAVARDRKTGMPFFTEQTARATVDGLYAIKVVQLNARQRKRLVKKFGRRVEGALMRAHLSKTSESVYAVDLRLAERFDLTNRHMPPLLHPTAKAVDKAKAQEIVAGETALIIDVRRAQHFAIETLPNAVNFPVMNYRRSAFRVVPPERLPGTVVIPPQALPKSKSTPILTFGNAPYDMSGYNLASYLTNIGYANVHWYRDGFEGWKGMRSETPESVSGVSIVTAKQARSMISKENAVVLDVRGATRFKWQHIAGAMNLQYFEARDRRGTTFFRPFPIEVEGIKKNDQGFFPEQLAKVSKMRPLIVVAQSEFDWRGPKAAALLKASGFSNVSWLRRGWRSWFRHARQDPKEFRIEPERNINRKRQVLTDSRQPAKGPVAPAKGK